MSVCMYVYKNTMCLLGIGIRGGWEAPSGYWGMNLGLLKEQQVFFLTSVISC